MPGPQATAVKFAIIGAGMAGLACASALKAAGHKVALFDKGRGPGGRMSTRRLTTPLGDVAIDHGAQYFTARNPAFRRVVGAWSDLGIVAPWPLVAADAWIGIPGMSEIIRHMAEDQDVCWGRPIMGMIRQQDGWYLMDETATNGPFDRVLLAIPAEQAAALLSLHDFAMARVALSAHSHPCWTSMLVFDRNQDGQPPVIRKRGIINWAARNSAKPGRVGPDAWVIQAGAAWSLTQMEAFPEQVSAMLGSALAQVVGQPVQGPIAAVSHRWRYAIAAGTGDGALWNHRIGLGACGDWLLGPRVECAWLSGRKLAEHCLG